MEKAKMKMKPILILMLLAAMCGAAYGQVTIGAGLEPVKGALLDLKENDDSNGDKTATKGMMLPRVNLTDLSKLTGGSAISGVSETGEDDLSHIGLTVYNVANCPGIYVWTGTEWIKLGSPCVMLPAAPVGTGVSFCVSAEANTLNISGTANAGETVDFYDMDTGGNLLITGTTVTTTYTIPDALTSSRTYCAEARHLTTNAVSATRTAVTATRLAGAEYTGAGTMTICSGDAGATFPSAPNGYTYTWNPVTLSNTASGNYAVTVTNTATGCANTVSNALAVTVNQLSSLELLTNRYGTTDASGNLRIDIPSGLDARGSAISTFNLTIKSNPLATLASPTNDYSGAVAFSSTPWTAGTLTSNPRTYNNVQATAMTTTLVTATNPWKTRQTVLTFSGQAGCPPATASRTITLNQTNYALMATSSSETPDATNQVRLVAIRETSTTPADLYIHGNTAWKAVPTTGTAANLTKVITNTYTTSDNVAVGADNSENGKTATQFSFTKAQGAYDNLKYTMADMVYSDTATVKRAKDMTVTFVQCQGTPNMTGVVVASNNNDPAWQANWGTNVVRHPAKTNIYEEFFSADFGPAGRWMTTNLAAWAYDGISHSQAGQGSNFNLTLNASGSDPYPYWCYPDGGTTKNAGVSNVTFLANPHLGLLYNWSAATAGKGGLSGQENIYQNAGTSNPMRETAMPEGTGANQQQRIQGICPQGWHLPSDREWFILTKEIIRRTTLYSLHPSDINPAESVDGALAADICKMPGVGSTTTVTSGWQGAGLALVDLCGLEGQAGYGTSRSAYAGGFAGLPAGNQNANTFGARAMWWSSSSYNTGGSLSRNLGVSNGSMVRDLAPRQLNLSAIRCVKDKP